MSSKVDTENTETQPLLDWLIILFFFAFGLLGLVSNLLFLFRLFPAVEVQDKMWAARSSFDFVAVAFISLLEMGAACAFFLWRKIAIVLFSAALISVIAKTSFDILTQRHLLISEIEWPSFAASNLPTLIAIIYCYRLSRVGLLK